jgi:enoyl-CoA hydratase/carnithine racemase
MAYEHILVDREDGVGIVTLNRPDKLNAMNRKLTSELREAVKEFDHDDAIGCIVIAGAGEKAFSAGGDIHEQREDDRRYTQGNWKLAAAAAATRSPPAPSRRSA